MTIKQLERTAYHEAGHVVMSYKFNVGIKNVTIIPNEKENRLGCVSQYKIRDTDLSPDMLWLEKSKNKIEKRIGILMAGYIAEKLFFKRVSSVGSCSDMKKVAQWIDGLSGPIDLNNAHYEYLYLKTYYCLKDPLRKYLIKIIAKELLNKKYMKGKEIREFIINFNRNSLKDDKFNNYYKRELKKNDKRRRQKTKRINKKI